MRIGHLLAVGCDTERLMLSTHSVPYGLTSIDDSADIMVHSVAAAGHLLQDGPVAGEADGGLGGVAELHHPDGAIAEAELHAGGMVAAETEPVSAILTGRWGCTQSWWEIIIARDVGSTQAVAGAHGADAEP